MPVEAAPTDPRSCSTSSVPAESLRSQLRNNTAAAHARLDSVVGAVNLQATSDYCRFLQAHAEAVLPLEATLADSGVRRLFPDWDQRTRSRVLVEDITLLNGDVQPFTPLQKLDADAILGTMYVLEGSRLGASVLLDTVKQSTDSAVREATAYLSHGVGTRLWPNFLRILESHAPALSDPTAAIAAARRTFAIFEAAMARLLRSGTVALASDRP